MSSRISKNQLVICVSGKNPQILSCESIVFYSVPFLSDHSVVLCLGLVKEGIFRKLRLLLDKKKMCFFSNVQRFFEVDQQLDNAVLSVGFFEGVCHAYS